MTFTKTQQDLVIWLKLATMGRNHEWVLAHMPEYYELYKWLKRTRQL